MIAKIIYKFLQRQLCNGIPCQSTRNHVTFQRNFDIHPSININPYISIQRTNLSFQNSSPSHYDILNIKPSATDSEIKDAYIKGCKKYHPDISNSPETSERFRQVQEAYRVLSNPSTKLPYDYQIGNMSQDIPYDYDGIEVKSAKKSRTPKDSYAERLVMQRWREDLIRKRRKMEREGKIPEEELNKEERKEKEQYEKFEKHFNDNLNKIHADVGLRNLLVRRLLLLTGYFLIFSLLVQSFSELFEPSVSDEIKALRKVDNPYDIPHSKTVENSSTEIIRNVDYPYHVPHSKTVENSSTHKTSFDRWTDTKKSYFENSPKFNPEPGKSE